MSLRIRTGSLSILRPFAIIWLAMPRRWKSSVETYTPLTLDE